MGEVFGFWFSVELFWFLVSVGINAFIGWRPHEPWWLAALKIDGILHLVLVTTVTLFVAMMFLVELV